MENYQMLIGVVMEKLGQTYKELKFHYDSLGSVLAEHSPEERKQIPELTTMEDLRGTYGELIRTLEDRYPGIRGL
ncbi:hypothetical protein N6H14_15590 [Paenibacillus sp. CC-CFT747]|nr:hypothetical protein N6H14_15590 [Paenibacillus sp. CC-CFT747]